MAGLIILVDIALGILGAYLLNSYLTPRNQNLPPGPKPRPLIGNLLDLPKSYDWLHWAKHKDLYGPISSVTVFGQHLVIINDAQVAFDLLEKKSSMYSDRPTFVFGGEMCGWEHTLALLHYGDTFRAYRRNIHQVIGSKNAVSRFFPLEELETRRLLSRVASTPDKLYNHIRTMAGAIILKISHGYTIESKGSDPLVDLADEALVQFSLSTTPGAWLVDVLPILRSLPDWLPGNGFKRTAGRWRKTLTELAEKPHAFVKRQMVSGTVVPSYTSDLLEKSPNAADEHIVKWSAASLYSGGADTTVSAIHGFYLAMVLYPEVQKMAQAELDSVLDGERLPTFEDRPQLPYTEAVLKEVLRWHPVAPMGLPHVNIEDDMYNGYFIPKGAILMANIWQITHDSANFHDPMAFKPERFLGGDGRAPEMDTHNLSFGFGRRICPGKELADSSIFMAIAMSLAVFNITKARDARGLEIEPLNEVTTGVISHTKEFQCSITPRSAKATALIKSVDEEFPLPSSDAGLLASL